MISIPAPFVVALLLAVLALVNHHQLKDSATGVLFSSVLWLFVVSEVIIGLRWMLGLVSLMPLAALSAISGVIILYLAFTSLGRRGAAISWTRDWMHSIPILLIVIGALTFVQLLEIVIIVTKLFYTGLLVQQARNAPDSLQFVRLAWFKDTQRALWGAAAFLLLGALVDVAISIDFALYEGEHSARLVGYANLIMLLPLGLACVIAGGDSVVRNKDENLDEAALQIDADNKKNVNHSLESKVSQSEDEQASLLTRLNELLIDEKLFADTELSLQRLARKAGVPTRSVSRAINSQTGLNMSQWVNNARIDAVCRLLSQSDISIAQCMFECGFTTKSNFNREFRRVTGCSPSAWREQHSSSQAK